MEKSLNSLAYSSVLLESRYRCVFLCIATLCDDVVEKIGVGCSTTIISVSLVFSSVPSGYCLDNTGVLISR